MKKIILAGCVIQNPQGKILLIHRNTPQRTQWETPGGKIEEDEDAEQTAVREIKEEVGVDIEIIRRLGQKDFQEDEFVMEYIWFLAKVVSGEPKLMEEKYDKLDYFSWEELNQMNDLSGNAQNLVKAYNSKEISL